jgi:hypothetical protein
MHDGTMHGLALMEQVGTRGKGGSGALVSRVLNSSSSRSVTWEVMSLLYGTRVKIGFTYT